jgi:outer membrane protein assembly factor BamB
MRRKPSRAAVIAFVFGCATMLGAQRPQVDYTQWRGRDRDGAASGFLEPASWPDTLTRKWKVDVGAGYGTPLVVGNAVYVFTRIQDDEVMTALSADTGQRLWRTSYPAPYSPSQPAAAHGAGPKATPLFHEGKLFTLGISGIVAAFDQTSGTLLWKTAAPAEPPEYGAASSPVGDKGIVIVHPGNYGPLTAFDAGTGTVRWTAGDEGLYASPIIVDLGGTHQVISATAKNLVGVSVNDGKVLWQHPFANNGAITPVVFGDTIIFSGLDMGVVALKPVKRDGTWVAAAVWDTKEVSMFMSNPVVIGDTLFGLSHKASGQFFALDARTGAVLWLGAPRAATNSAVVKAGDLLFLLNDDAELIVARNNRRSFEPLKRYTVADGATWAQPAISSGRLFIKDVSSLALWTLR